MVEYTLALVAIVLVIAGAARALTNAGETELENQSNCVSERPPPPSCQLRQITTTTTLFVSPPTPTTAATTSTSTTTTIP